jgi:tetratricopeptide (TPR) repeat protein
MRMAEASETSGYGTGGGGGGWWPKLDMDLDNIRAGIEWSISSGKADRALRILGASVYFWFARGHQITEWNDSVQNALSRPEGRERTLARAKALNGMGFWYWADLAPTDRRADLEEALAIGRELGDDWNVATALRTLGLLENIQGNYTAARTLLEESLEIWQRLGPSAGGARAISLTFLGDLALIQDQDEEARRLYEESVRILAERMDSNWQAYSVRRLGHLAWRAAEHRRALSLVSESLRLNQEVFDPRGVLACLAAFAAVETWKGAYERGAVLAASAETQLRAWGIRLLFVDRKEYERTLATLRERLGPKKFDRLWARGAGLSLEASLAFAVEGGD